MVEHGTRSDSRLLLPAPPLRAIHLAPPVLVVGVATLVRLALDPFLGDQVAYLTYVASAVLATWWCGIPAGLLTTVVGAFAGNYFFVAPRYEFIPHAQDWVAMLLMMAVSLALVFIVGRWRQAERDVRQRAEELAQANMLKDDFLATLSHELRTPLNAVIGWSDMLLVGNLSEQVTRRALESINANARAQCQMINDILDVSRIKSGKTRINTALVDPVRVIEDALDAIRPAAKVKGVAITTHLAAPSAPIVGDPDRLQQVFWNLVANAVKFTPAGGEVEVTLRFVHDEMQVDVRDTGIGISDDFLPHVFETFRQFDSSTTRKYGGLGLGLAIVRHLVELHGGRVTAASEGEGRGACFTVFVPARLALERRHREEPTKRIVAAVADVPDNLPNVCGLQVLVVDDDAQALELASSVLKSHGAVPTVASSAEAAFRTLKQSTPDIMLVDLAMPEVDGYAFIRRVRHEAAGEGASVPAIALTAYAREEDRRKALLAGFNDHLAKPVTPAALVRAIARVRTSSSLRYGNDG